MTRKTDTKASSSSPSRCPSPNPARMTPLRPAALVAAFLLLIAFPWISIAEDTQHQDNHVLVLDASNFSDAVKEHDFLVVEFYAPWCGHCKQLAPEYEKAASILKMNDPPIILANVDANSDTNKGLASEYGVRGYPTLKIFENKGEIVREYKGPRNSDGIVAYLKKQVGPASQEIKTAEEGHKLVEDNDILVVGIFSSYDSEEFVKFTSVAAELRSDFEFRHTLDASFLPTQATDIKYPTIRIFKKFDEGYDDLKEFDIQAIKKFLEDVSIPYVVLFNKDPTQRMHLSKIFAKPEDAKAFLFIDAEDDNVKMKELFEELAKEYRGKGVRFLIADTEDGLNAMQYFGANKETLPSIVIQGNDEKKYMLEKAQVSNTRQWLKDYFDGVLSEFYKSEPVPEKNDDPVKIVVLDTFEEIVLKSGKNVLLEFYAPWCGHCKNLAPILEEVAISLQSDPDVVIAKMDATANDIKDKRFDVQGFPTLYLHTAAGELIPYVGNRSKDDLINFIVENKGGIEKSEIVKEDAEVVKDEL